MEELIARARHLITAYGLGRGRSWDCLPSVNPWRSNCRRLTARPKVRRSPFRVAHAMYALHHAIQANQKSLSPNRETGRMSTEALAQETLITLTADIVSAHVSNNSVSVSDVAGLINNVHSALSGLAAPKEQEAPKQQPAVSVRASIKPDHLVCLEDGKKMTMLKRHLMTAYGMIGLGRKRTDSVAAEPAAEPAAKAPSKRGRKPKVTEPELA